MSAPRIPTQAIGGLARVLIGGGLAVYGATNSLFNVEGGHRGIVFNRLVGIKEEVYAEGTHLMVPWFERPVIFDVRARPSLIQSQSGSRDLQMVSCVLIVVKVGSSCMYRIQSVSVQDPGVQFCLAAKAHGR
eukprot:GHRR01023364.1.p1 GENE.GHRR01023364.1~~GHRR01023364.1.p1  ORF type:complete len:132 (+),score=17.43 GHRR01023364.1:182-577(+)